ncbi:uncharacterized protein N7458_000270, partial [Penicillium daleae]
ILYISGQSASPSPAVSSIIGLVVEFVVAIDEARVRFTDDAQFFFSLYSFPISDSHSIRLRIIGLVVEFVVAIDEARVRFTDDAFLFSFCALRSETLFQGHS